MSLPALSARKASMPSVIRYHAALRGWQRLVCDRRMSAKRIGLEPLIHASAIAKSLPWRQIRATT